MRAADRTCPEVLAPLLVVLLALAPAACERAPVEEIESRDVPVPPEAFVQAAADGHVDIVRAWIAAGANPGQSTLRGITPLIAAARSGQIEVCRVLLDAGVRIDSHEFDDGETALAAAASAGFPSIVALLLENGADPASVDGHGLNPLARAVDAGREETVRAFLDRGIHPDTAGSQHETPLSRAILRGNLSMARLLLERGADPNLTAADGLLPLQIAMALGDSEMIALLRLHDASASPASALSNRSLLDSVPPSLPADWSVTDPFTNSTRYFSAYALVSTTFDPPQTRRSLLRSSEDGQSQLFLILGQNPAWAERLADARRVHGDGTVQVESGIIPIDNVFSMDFDIVRLPTGTIGAADVTRFLGSARCGDWLLIVDAAGLTETFDWELIEQLVSEIRLRPVLDCPPL